MNPNSPKKEKLEATIQKEIIDFLTLRGWFVKIMHGNLYQSGVPDLYICKRSFGTRWVEVKRPTKYKFTAAQYETFPRFAAESVGIWVLTAANDFEYAKLFKPPNFHYYMYK